MVFIVEEKGRAEDEKTATVRLRMHHGSWGGFRGARPVGFAKCNEERMIPIDGPGMGDGVVWKAEGAIV